MGERPQEKMVQCCVCHVTQSIVNTVTLAGKSHCFRPEICAKNVQDAVADIVQIYNSDGVAT